jgi:chemotaxis protein MotA
VDKSSFGGVFVALGGILLGLVLEGGKIGQILQPTAALIVFGGTLGAVMLQFPLPIMLEAFGSLARVFFETGEDPRLVLKEMVGTRKRRARPESSRSTTTWSRSRSLF